MSAKLEFTLGHGDGVLSSFSFRFLWMHSYELHSLECRLCGSKAERGAR